MKGFSKQERGPVFGPDEGLDRHAGDDGCTCKVLQSGKVDGDLGAVVARAAAFVRQHVTGYQCDMPVQFRRRARGQGGEDKPHILVRPNFVNMGHGHMGGDEQWAVLRHDMHESIGGTDNRLRHCQREAKDKAGGRRADVEPPDPLGDGMLAFGQFQLARHDVAQIRLCLLLLLGREAGNLYVDLGDTSCGLGLPGDQLTLAPLGLWQFAFDGRYPRGLGQILFQKLFLRDEFGLQERNPGPDRIPGSPQDGAP